MPDGDLDPSMIVHLIVPLVTDETNEVRSKEFSDKEISDALFQIGLLKFYNTIRIK